MGDNGFTILELLVVGAVIILLSIISFPFLDRVRESLELERSANLLSAEIGRTRELAISVKEIQVGSEVVIPQGYGIKFEVISPKDYQILVFADCNGDKDYTFGSLCDGKSELLKSFKLSSKVYLESLFPDNPLTVVFYPPDPVLYVNQETQKEAQIVISTKRFNIKRKITIQPTGLIEIQR